MNIAAVLFDCGNNHGVNDANYCLYIDINGFAGSQVCQKFNRIA